MNTTTLYNDGDVIVVVDGRNGTFVVTRRDKAYGLIASLEFAMDMTPAPLPQGMPAAEAEPPPPPPASPEVDAATPAPTRRGRKPKVAEAATPAAALSEAAPSEAAPPEAQAGAPAEAAPVEAKPRVRKSRAPKAAEAAPAEKRGAVIPKAKLTDLVLAAVTRGEKRLVDLVKLKDVTAACSSDDPKLIRMVVARALTKLASTGAIENIGDAYRLVA